MAFKKVMVVGAGTMGHGIAQVCAQAGLDAVLIDVDRSFVDRAIERIRSGLEKRVEKGKMTKEEVKDIMSRISGGTEIEAVMSKDVDFVIEAVVEDVEVKKQIFARLDVNFEPNVILATNTTACPITEIASAAKHSDRVIGMHFFNPPVVMKLVEIMPALQTSKETVEKTKEFAEFLGKTPIAIKIETPAGIVSRILGALLNEAVVAYSEGVAEPQDIDTAMKLGANLPMGPLELIDMIGVDVHLAKMETLFRELGDLRYRPPYILKKMVRAGYLGRKSGRGFYTYEQ